jgi:hypothetical protein
MRHRRPCAGSRDRGGPQTFAFFTTPTQQQCSPTAKPSDGTTLLLTVRAVVRRLADSYPRPNSTPSSRVFGDFASHRSSSHSSLMSTLSLSNSTLSAGEARLRTWGCARQQQGSRTEHLHPAIWPARQLQVTLCHRQTLIYSTLETSSEPSTFMSTLVPISTSGDPF